MVIYQQNQPKKLVKYEYFTNLAATGKFLKF